MACTIYTDVTQYKQKRIETKEASSYIVSLLRINIYTWKWQCLKTTHFMIYASSNKTGYKHLKKWGDQGRMKDFGCGSMSNKCNVESGSDCYEKRLDSVMYCWTQRKIVELSSSFRDVLPKRSVSRSTGLIIPKTLFINFVRITL